MQLLPYGMQELLRVTLQGPEEALEHIPQKSAPCSEKQEKVK